MLFAKGPLVRRMSQNAAQGECDHNYSAAGDRTRGIKFLVDSTRKREDSADGRIYLERRTATVKSGPVHQQAEKSARKARVASSKRAPVVHEEVYARLRRAIIDGQLEPGRALSVRILAAQFSISAMPAREAIRRLVALGALEMTKTRRITVARLTSRKADELTEARTLIEPRLAVRALRKTEESAKARQALVARLSRIDAKLDAAIDRGDVAAYSKSNSDFHFALYAAAEAPVLLGVAESLWLQIGPFMRVVVQRLGASTMVDQHKEAIDALAAGDAKKLEKAVRLDILEGMTRIGAAMRPA